MSAPLIFVRDGRTLPFVPVTLDALAAISEKVPARRLAYARSLYLAVLEIANESRSELLVAASRKQLGERAGCSRDLVSDLAPMLETAGVVRITERFHGSERVANEWTIVEPGTSDPRGSQPRPLADESHDPSGAQPQQSLEGKNTEKGVDERARVRYRGKVVPQPVLDASRAALAGFADISGQRLRDFDGNGKPTESLKRIIGAMMTFPDVVERWPAMIARAFADPWWSDDAPGVGVVFGPNVVERSLAAAERPANGRANVTPMRRRSGRSTAADYQALKGQA